MDINYILLLDCSVGEIIKIRLSEEEKIEFLKIGGIINQRNFNRIPIASKICDILCYSVPIFHIILTDSFSDLFNSFLIYHLKPSISYFCISIE